MQLASSKSLAWFLMFFGEVERTQFQFFASNVHHPIPESKGMNTFQPQPSTETR